MSDEIWKSDAEFVDILRNSGLSTEEIIIKFPNLEAAAVRRANTGDRGCPNCESGNPKGVLVGTPIRRCMECGTIFDMHTREIVKQ